MQCNQFCKIKSITLDTNVLLDLPDVPTYKNHENKTITDTTQKARYERVMDSYMAALLCLTENIAVNAIGIKTVEKELPRWLLPIFYNIFPKVLVPDKRVKKLAAQYDLSPADASIVAITSVNNIDVLLSWNRNDIANENACKKIRLINKGQNYSTPIICTPTYFIDRLYGSQGKHPITLAFSPSPVLKIYRLKFFPSKSHF